MKSGLALNITNLVKPQRILDLDKFGGIKRLKSRYDNSVGVGVGGGNHSDYIVDFRKEILDYDNNNPVVKYVTVSGDDEPMSDHKLEKSVSISKDSKLESIKLRREALDAYESVHSEYSPIDVSYGYGAKRMISKIKLESAESLVTEFNLSVSGNFLAKLQEDFKVASRNELEYNREYLKYFSKSHRATINYVCDTNSVNTNNLAEEEVTAYFVCEVYGRHDADYFYYPSYYGFNIHRYDFVPPVGVNPHYSLEDTDYFVRQLEVHKENLTHLVNNCPESSGEVDIYIEEVLMPLKIVVDSSKACLVRKALGIVAKPTRLTPTYNDINKDCPGDLGKDFEYECNYLDSEVINSSTDTFY